MEHAVVISDGECSFCNRWVDVLLRFDRKDIFHFAARQSETGAVFAAQSGLAPEGMGSIIVVQNSQILLRSDAVLRLLTLLGLPFSLMGVFRLISTSLRDAAYDVIARNRHRWSGKALQCGSPSPAERHRFL